MPRELDPAVPLPRRPAAGIAGEAVAGGLGLQLGSHHAHARDAHLLDYGKRLSGMPPLRPSCSLKRAATNWCLDRGVMTTSDRRRSTRRRCRQLATGPFVSLQSDAYRRSCPGNSGADLDVADLKHASTSRRMTIPQSSSRLSYSLHKPPGWVRSCSTSGILQNQTSKRASACSDGHQRK